MESPVILSKLEQEYLLSAIEAVVPVDHPRRLFLWAQGPLQALLPHQALVCLQRDGDGQVRDLQCLYGSVLERHALARLAGPDGLAMQAATLWHAGAARPAVVEACGQDDAWLDGHQQGQGVQLPAEGADASVQRRVPPHAALQAALQPALRAAQRATGYHGLFANMLMHGSGQLAGGATFFVLFGMPFRPGPRHAYVMQLLLPHLHLAWLRMAASGAVADAVAPAPAEMMRAVSPREVEILQWVRDGKSNEEVGMILGISGLTVKNHLQRIYKTLGVSNRAQAVARGIALRVLPVSGAPH